MYIHKYLYDVLLLSTKSGKRVSFIPWILNSNLTWEHLLNAKGDWMNSIRKYHSLAYGYAYMISRSFNDQLHQDTTSASEYSRSILLWRGEIFSFFKKNRCHLLFKDYFMYGKYWPQLRFRWSMLMFNLRSFLNSLALDKLHLDLIYVSIKL